MTGMRPVGRRGGPGYDDRDGSGALMTADEYLALGEEFRGTQLIAGEVVVTSRSRAPARLHGPARRARDLVASRAWRGRVAARRPLDDRNVYARTSSGMPRAGPGRDDGRPSPMPNIAVEVRSPSTWRYDVRSSCPSTRSAGCRSCGSSTRARTPCSSSGGRAATPGFDVALELELGEQLTSPQLPGFSLALSELFATPADARYASSVRRAAARSRCGSQPAMRPLRSVQRWPPPSAAATSRRSASRRSRRTRARARRRPARARRR